MKRWLAAALLIPVALAVFAAPADAGISPNKRAQIRKPGPIRVLIMGDSLMARMQTRLQPLLGSDYFVITGGIGGSGMLDQNHCDGTWAQALVNNYDPDVVVLEYVGNYKLRQSQGVASCVATGYGTAKFWNKWRASVNKNQKILRSRGAQTIWTLVPSTNVHNIVGNYAAAAPKLNALVRKAAPKGEIVDLWSAFGGATPNVPLHHADGLHLSDAGYNLFATMVANAVKN